MNYTVMLGGYGVEDGESFEERESALIPFTKTLERYETHVCKALEIIRANITSQLLVYSALDHNHNFQSELSLCFFVSSYHNGKFNLT